MSFNRRQFVAASAAIAAIPAKAKAMSGRQMSDAAIGRRLSFAREAKGLSVNECCRFVSAEIAEYAKNPRNWQRGPMTIAEWRGLESGTETMDMLIASYASRLLAVNIGWLAVGEGPMTGKA
jgi:hypothetical protein